MDRRLGTLTINMDGEWDVEDLSEFADGLEGVYGYFYALVVDDADDHGLVLRRRIDDLVQGQFWNNRFGPSWVGERIYSWLPRSDGMRIKSITYASPGAITIVALLAVIRLAASVVQAWTRAGSGLIDLYEKVEKFFKERPHLARPKRTFNLGEVSGRDVDDARNLMFDLGREIGLSDPMIERTLDMAGNPISGLRYMVALALQARNVADLQARGLLELPPVAVRESSGA